MDDNLRSIRRQVQASPDDEALQGLLTETLARMSVIRRKVPFLDETLAERNQQKGAIWLEWQDGVRADGSFIQGEVREVRRVQLETGLGLCGFVSREVNLFTIESEVGDRDIVAVVFKGAVNADDVENWFKLNGYRSATLQESLNHGPIVEPWYGSSYVALGTQASIEGKIHVVCAGPDDRSSAANYDLEGWFVWTTEVTGTWNQPISELDLSYETFFLGVPLTPQDRNR